MRKNIEYVREALEKLIKGEPIEADIDKSIDYNVLETEREIYGAFLYKAVILI